MAINPALFSSASDNHPTPQDLFDQLNAEFHFTLDPSATAENAKCPNYYGPDQDIPELRDGLAVPWDGVVWCNPPYGREVTKWVEKAWEETFFGRAEVVVMLLPVRTDTRWFHEWCEAYAAEIRFIKGRLKFGDAANAAPFPSMLVIWRSPVRSGPYTMMTVKVA